MTARVHEPLGLKGIKIGLGGKRKQRGVLKIMSLNLKADFIAKKPSSHVSYRIE